MSDTEKSNEIIWAEWEKQGEKYSTKLYQYSLNGQKVLLEDRYEFRDFICSKDREKLLSFIGGEKRFRIAEYNIRGRQLKEILDLEAVDLFLDENGYEKSAARREGSCVRYYDEERKISFIYDRYIMGYSEQMGLEVIYSMQAYSGNEYRWAENDGVLLICEKRNLVKYDMTTGEKEILAEAIRSFDVSEDGKFIVFADGKKVIWRYDVESGEKKKLYTCSHPQALPRISGDGKYLFCRDLFCEDKVAAMLNFRETGAITMGIVIMQIESGEVVDREEFGNGIIGVAWR